MKKTAKKTKDRFKKKYIEKDKVTLDQKKAITYLSQVVDEYLTKLNVDGFVVSRPLENNVFCIIEVKRAYVDETGEQIEVNMQ